MVNLIVVLGDELMAKANRKGQNWAKLVTQYLISR